MNSDLPLFPARASVFAADVDHLFFYLLGVAIFFSTLIFVLVIFFAVRYRRRTAQDRAEQITSSLPLELAWTIIPLGLEIVMFWWGATLFVQHASPPPDATDIYVVAKQWMWKVQHAEGPREINELHVPTGRSFRLVMTSEDVIHSFFMPAFRIKQDVLPNRYTTLWFNATTPGKYHLFCTQYCGTNHARMGGWVYVLDDRDYERWLGSAERSESMVSTGAAIFARLGCESCHGSENRPRGPALAGLYGKQVVLADGRTVSGDDAYIEESIVAPAAKITRGYEPIMPTFKGQVSEDDLFQLVAYIKSLKAPERMPVSP
ncbi:MAG TPA: cytochrome c oxidase subunit II [Vicinamibacterales bacterium]|jgi:cytochrome c oxidase subunit 2